MCVYTAAQSPLHPLTFSLQLQLGRVWSITRPSFSNQAWPWQPFVSFQGPECACTGWKTRLSKMKKKEEKRIHPWKEINCPCCVYNAAPSHYQSNESHICYNFFFISVQWDDAAFELICQITMDRAEMNPWICCCIDFQTRPSKQNLSRVEEDKKKKERRKRWPCVLRVVLKDPNLRRLLQRAKEVDLTDPFTC